MRRYNFFFSFLATLRHVEFPGQGVDLSCRCNLCCRCSTSGSFNTLCPMKLRPGAAETLPILLCHSANSKEM